MSVYTFPFLLFCMVGDQSGAQLGCVDSNEADTVTEYGQREPAPITAYSDTPTLLRFGYRNVTDDGCTVVDFLEVRALSHSQEPWLGFVTIVVDEDRLSGADFESPTSTNNRDALRPCAHLD
jgi:hypothetical protein